MMPRKYFLTLALIFSFLTPLFSQTSQPAQQRAQPNAPAAERQQPEEDVVRITTNLVQVDAVVTDSNGRQVTDLAAGDFEIREDNREQNITNFSYVSTETSAPASTSARGAGRSAPVPPVHLRPEDVRRTYAIVVDDLGLSFQNVGFVRAALKRFVDEQMQPGDLVAIIRTGGGTGVLQQFTSDRRQLYAAIEHVRWNQQGRGTSLLGMSNVLGADTIPSSTLHPQQLSNLQQQIIEQEQQRQELFTIGTLGALDAVVRGMRELPGRKSVLLISDGFKIWLRPGQMSMTQPDISMDTGHASQRILDRLRKLTDLANRASTVIYAISARGLVAGGLTADQDLSGDLNQGPDRIEQRLSEGRDDELDSRFGLIYLAERTGGFAVYGSNDLNRGMGRVLDDQKGYYLIAYHPSESTFAQDSNGYKRFHKIIVKVKRPGLRVRSRTGFYGVSDETVRPVRRTRNEQLIGALDSPFKATGVDLQMSSFFANDAHTGSFMRSLLHINARDLTFVDDTGGFHKSTFDVLAITFGDNGQVVDEMGRTHNIRVSDRTYRRIMEQGFDYMITIPVKKPGAYQLRVALRDTATERLGSASQFIEVPDITKNRLALSGVIMSGAEAASVRQTAARTGAQAGGNAQAPAQGLAQSEDEVGAADTQAGPALRQLRQGMMLEYGYAIYNAQLDRATQKPQLTTQVRLYRDGQQVFAGRVQSFNVTGQTDLKRLTALGALKIGSDLSPGQYVLQVTVTDALARANSNTATQWIDFEIVR
ncbi:MAG TPA: VWA domain-containing protein [Pyrinomonadaceae bacterium]|nr:VWA domain-containing protein [Pyrinomonadaceae bacterium]